MFFLQDMTSCLTVPLSSKGFFLTFRALRGIQKSCNAKNLNCLWLLLCLLHRGSDSPQAKSAVVSNDKHRSTGELAVTNGEKSVGKHKTAGHVLAHLRDQLWMRTFSL